MWSPSRSPRTRTSGRQNRARWWRLEKLPRERTSPRWTFRMTGRSLESGLARGKSSYVTLRADSSCARWAGTRRRLPRSVGTAIFWEYMASRRARNALDIAVSVRTRVESGCKFLASGGNDNVVNIWNGRVGDVTEGSMGGARWTKRNHSASVKVLYRVFILLNSSFSAQLHFRRAPSLVLKVLPSCGHLSLQVICRKRSIQSASSLHDTHGDSHRQTSRKKPLHMAVSTPSHLFD